MRIDYIAATFHQDGPKLMGRSLFRHLSLEHDTALLGAIVEPGSKLLEGPNAQYCGVENDGDADVVFLEGGWVEALGFPRARRHFLEEFARAGGVVVVADLARNAAETQRKELEGIRGPWPRPRYGLGVRYLHDEGARDLGNAQRFFISEMTVSDWLTPALKGVESLLVWGAVELHAGDGIAASGHGTTKILVLDSFEDEGFPWPWASVKEHGKGFLVVIGAAITADPYVDACPDNARWLSNLLGLLHDRAHENRTWGQRKPAVEAVMSPGGDQTKSGPTPSSLLSVEESETHERKGSFLTPLDRPDATPEVVIQLTVLKAIAALANTEGGQLVIGQHDNGEVLGLKADFERLGRKQNPDGFELRLTEFIDHRLSRTWLQLGARLHWLADGEHDVAIVTVPRSSTPVWANLEVKGGTPDRVVVRSGPRTLTLQGPDLGEWIQARR